MYISAAKDTYIDGIKFSSIDGIQLSSHSSHYIKTEQDLAKAIESLVKAKKRGEAVMTFMNSMD